MLWLFNRSTIETNNTKSTPATVNKTESNEVDKKARAFRPQRLRGRKRETEKRLFVLQSMNKKNYLMKEKMVEEETEQVLGCLSIAYFESSLYYSFVLCVATILRNEKSWCLNSQKVSILSSMYFCVYVSVFVYICLCVCPSRSVYFVVVVNFVGLETIALIDGTNVPNNFDSEQLMINNTSSITNTQTKLACHTLCAHCTSITNTDNNLLKSIIEEANE